MNSVRRCRHRLQRGRCVCGLWCRQRVAYRRGRPFSYKSSRVRLLWGQPVSLELGEMREGFQIRHAIEVDVAHQVIELMLDDTREKAFGRDLNLLPIPIEGIDTQLAPPWDAAAKFRNAETTFPIFDQLLI